MRRPQRGFTLVELMITVVLIGILVSIAVYTWTKQTRQARSAEVHAMFTEFKTRQQMYYNENSTYVSTGASDTDYHPPGPTNGTTALAPIPPSWVTLKMKPTKTSVYCSYVTRSGAGGDASNIGATAMAFGMATAPAEDWYYVIAECDFDGNPTKNSFYFTRSDNTMTWERDPGR